LRGVRGVLFGIIKEIKSDLKKLFALNDTPLAPLKGGISRAALLA
jgi:hypothetical protein